MIEKHWLSSLPEGKEAKGWFAVLGWGAFLGTSWTWVIGMVLPALLIRDMGIAGFIIFALPNCIGAAAMGSVLSSKSARLLPKRHGGMILTFSIVTVAYHFYIAGYLIPNLLGLFSLALFAGSALLASGFIALWKDKGALIFSMIVWLVSISAFIYSLCHSETTPFAIYDEKPLLDASYMWFFLPASVGGFLLCPYLDATFIRARARTSQMAGALAFKVGFLVIFASMIIFTTAYGHKLVEAFAGEETRLEGVWGTILLVHIPLQMGLTVVWHGREIFECCFSWLKDSVSKVQESDCKPCAKISRNFVIAGFISSLAGCVIVFSALFLLGVLFRNMSFELFEDFKIANDITTFIEAYKIERYISVGEIGYRCILIFYGTLFPAYVMLMMLPTLYPSDKKRPWWLFAITVALSSATAYLGFVHDMGWAIGATLAIICVARLWVDFSAMIEYKRGIPHQ